MIVIEIDERSLVPPFEQIRSQLDAAIRSGVLGPGTKLPPVRQLAADLGIAPNTVARAYTELEAAGLVAGAGRRGTTVSPRTAAVETERRRLMDDAAERFVAELARLDATSDDARRALDRAVRRLGPQSRPTVARAGGGPPR